MQVNKDGNKISVSNTQEEINRKQRDNNRKNQDISKVSISDVYQLLLDIQADLKEGK